MDDDRPESLTGDVLHHLGAVTTTEFVDKYGKKRVRRTISYYRSDAARTQATSYRLGTLVGTSVLPPNEWEKAAWIHDRHRLFVGYNEEQAKRIVATRLVKIDESPHKVAHGADLLRDWFDKDLPGEVYDAYSWANQLFLFFGFVDHSRNKALPGLFWQTYCKRRFDGKHCWVFMPEPLDRMNESWPSDDSILLRFRDLPTMGPNHG